MYALIHGCWLHFTGIMISARANRLMSGGAPGGCDWFHSRFFLGMGWILWVVASLETTRSSCPAMIPSTCGSYTHACWSRITGLAGTGKLYFSAPALIDKHVRQGPVAIHL